MASKSDFAQKLLHDLKLRKEKMAATQSSSRDSRGFQGNASHSYRDARKAQSQLEISKGSSRTGNNSKRSNGNSRSIITEASSNQVVLYERGSSKSSVSSSSSVKDLSMAIAFAFENNGNLSKIAVRSSNPLVNFFNRFSGRSSSRDSKRREIMSVANNSTRGVTTYEFSNVSHVHINEISKGIQKLNQILRACSNGVDLDKNSIEVGKELLRGAMELEESLKMLAKFQQGSDSASRVEKSSRIRLLEEEEEDDDDRGDLRKNDLDRPRFSFDKPSSRAKSRPNQQLLMLPYFNEAQAKQSFNESKAIPHSRSSSCVSDFDGCSPSHSVKEKAKITNVIAKLMGLEELPQNVKKDSSLERKEKNASIRKSDEVSDDLFIGNCKIWTKPVVKSDEKPLRGLFRKSSYTADKGKKDTVPELRRNTISIESKQSSVEGRERKVTDTRENKVRVSNEHKVLVDGEKLKDDRVGRKMINADKRKVTVDAARNQQLALEKLVPNEAQLLKKPKGSQVKSDSKPKVKQSHQKHNLIERRQKENQMESLKIEQGCQNLPMKQNHDKITQENGSEEISHNAASDQEKSLKQDHNLILGPREQSKDNGKGNNGISLENHFDQLASKKKTILKEFQKKENPRKIDLLLTRRNRDTNHPTTSLKHSANMFQDLKQRVNKKNISMKRTEQPSQNQEHTEVVDIMPMPDSAEEGREETTQQDTSHKEAAETVSSVRDDKRDDMSSDPEQVCEALVSSLDQPYASMDEREFKQSDRNCEDHKESVNAAHDKPHHEHKKLSLPSWSKEPLTEPEKDFKEVIIKDQLFLNTAEALFKLNLPVTFLQTHDQNGEAFSDKKLLLDCGYEVMKRKAMRHGYSSHPFQRNVVSHTKARSLDDLVKQLCGDFDALKHYGGDWNNDEQNIANCLHRMLEKDIYGKHPDVNCMWDHKWNTIRTIFTEMEDIVRDVEKFMLNGLLDDITNDLVPVIVAV